LQVTNGADWFGQCHHAATMADMIWDYMLNFGGDSLNTIIRKPLAQVCCAAGGTSLTTTPE